MKLSTKYYIAFMIIYVIVLIKNSLFSLNFYFFVLGVVAYGLFIRTCDIERLKDKVTIKLEKVKGQWDK